jgi:hypothetical protein
MDMCISSPLRPVPALQLLATSALSLYCAGAMARGANLIWVDGPSEDRQTRA